MVPSDPARPLVRVFRSLRHRVDAFKGGVSVVDFGHDVADFVEGLHVVGRIGEEGGKVPDREGDAKIDAFDDEDDADRDDDGVDGIVDEAGRRVDGRSADGSLVVVVAETEV
jgi:hypothetical protein